MDTCTRNFRFFLTFQTGILSFQRLLCFLTSTLSLTSLQDNIRLESPNRPFQFREERHSPHNHPWTQVFCFALEFCGQGATTNPIVREEKNTSPTSPFFDIVAGTHFVTSYLSSQWTSDRLPCHKRGSLDRAFNRSRTHPLSTWRIRTTLPLTYL